MKITRNFLFAGSLLTLCACTGCASAPTSAERFLFDIRTNYTPRVEYVTNQVPVVVEQIRYVTNEVAGIVTVTSTTNQTVSAVEHIQPVTNWVATVNWEPSTNATAIAQTGKAIGDPFGVGGIVGIALSGIFGLWGTIRSRRARKAAAVLAQGIETGRALLRDTPQGRDLDAEFVAWLERNQTATGVIREVLPIVDKTVSPEIAALVAERLKRAVPAK